MLLLSHFNDSDICVFCMVESYKKNGSVILKKGPTAEIPVSSLVPAFPET